MMLDRFGVLGLSFVFLLLYWCWSAARKLYFHPLSTIPGPKHWILSRLPYVSAVHRGDLATKVKDLHAEYGPVIRLATNEVSFIDEQAWTDIYAHHPGMNFPKDTDWYCGPANGTVGIVNATNEDHGRYRRVFAAAFSDKAIQKRESLILSLADLLMSQLRKELIEKNIVEIGHWFSCITLDLNQNLSFSESLDALMKGTDEPWGKLLMDSFTAMPHGAILRLLGLESMWQLIPSKVFWQKPRDPFRFLKDRIQSRLAEGDVAGKNDYMTLICRQGDEKGLSSAEIQATFIDFFMANSETVATALTAIIFHLVRAPDIKQQLTSEIRQHFPKERDITVNNVAVLPLLNAVINETLRLCPVAPIGLPRTVPKPGASVCGYWLPTGTHVNFAQLAANRSPMNFSLPEQFIPSRWLESASPTEPHNHKAHQPFSFGPRACLGKGLGLAEVRLIISKFLWNFDVARGEADWDWCSQKAQFIWNRRPLHVSLSVASD